MLAFSLVRLLAILVLTLDLVFFLDPLVLHIPLLLLLFDLPLQQTRQPWLHPHKLLP
jgi:hypothetical protein